MEKAPENRAEKAPETRKAETRRSAEAEAPTTKTDGTSDDRDAAVRKDEAEEYGKRVNPVAAYLSGKIDRPEPDLSDYDYNAGTGEGQTNTGTGEGNATE